MKEIQLTIESFSKKGFGVGFSPTGKRIEVSDAIIGDEVMVELKSRRKRGRVLSVVSPSKDRCTPKCQHATMCGGCTWQVMDYKSQLEQKEAIIQRSFSDLPTDFYPIIPCEFPWQYRNKMEFSFSENAAGAKYLGLMIAGAAPYVFNVELCHLAKPWFSETLSRVRTWWENSDLKAYHMHKNLGHLRTLILREGINTGEKLAMLTISGDTILDESTLNSFIEAIGPDIQIFIRTQNAQKGTPTTFTTTCLTDREYILEKLQVLGDELFFKVSPTSFFQPNTHQAEIIYNKALSLLEEESSLIFDLYSGTGTLGMLASKKAKKVIGIELNADAVKDALQNTELNKITNFEIIEGDVGKVITHLMSQEDFVRPDAVIVDPPRAGLDPLALHHLKTLLPKKIVYISCNPYTQAENITELKKAGYQLKLIQPIDQFPHTHHIENIALLSLPTENDS